jgi:hypothetical protein
MGLPSPESPAGHRSIMPGLSGTPAHIDDADVRSGAGPGHPVGCRETGSVCA